MLSMEQLICMNFLLQNEERRGLLNVAFSDKELSKSTAFE
jgi:hypothetical protein